MASRRPSSCLAMSASVSTPATSPSSSRQTSRGTCCSRMILCASNRSSRVRHVGTEQSMTSATVVDAGSSSATNLRAIPRSVIAPTRCPKPVADREEVHVGVPHALGSDGYGSVRADGVGGPPHDHRDDHCSMVISGDLAPVSVDRGLAGAETDAAVLGARRWHRRGRAARILSPLHRWRRSAGSLTLQATMNLAKALAASAVLGMLAAAACGGEQASAPGPSGPAAPDSAGKHGCGNHPGSSCAAMGAPSAGTAGTAPSSSATTPKNP